MRISGTTGTVLMLVALAAVGAGTYYFKTMQTNRKLELQAQTKQAQLKAKEAEQKTKEAEARTAEAAARQREADSKIKSAEAAKAADELAAKKQEAENLKAKTAADEAAAKKAEAEALAAEAETAKSAEAKAASEAAKAADAKRAEAEALALKRAEAERAKAADQRAKAEAAKAIADAARVKSENELKTAEANAQAERDRKLRMYRRAETSRAEMLALQRAERLLALDEAGALTAADLEAAANGDNPANAPAAPSAGETTNAVVKVDWPNAEDRVPKSDVAVGSLMKKLDEKTAAANHRRAREYIKTFTELADRAENENRLADAQHYRRTLAGLVPDYVEVYAELIDEARQAKNREADEAKLAKDLFELVPDWQRIAVCERLLQRDETYFSKLLAGKVDREVYVKAFRKLYDLAMRDKGDHDERRAKMAHICKVLATYVPDFEKLPEWK